MNFKTAWFNATSMLPTYAYRPYYLHSVMLKTVLRNHVSVVAHFKMQW